MIVITLYSYEGLTLAEIGQVLGVTASPVCQLHTKAVLKLRAKMQDAGRPLARTGASRSCRGAGRRSGWLSTISGNGPHRQAPPDSVTTDAQP
jgi:hypothetical protein